jgi:uncharacterized protein (DUF2267 family)
MTENQKTKAVTLNELQDMETLFSGKGDTRSLALYSLYTKIPPRRAQDYRLMKFGKDVYDNFNYLDLEKSNLIFNVYKTSNKYGQYISKIPKDLEMILKEYVKEHNLEDGDFLFYSNPSGALKTKNRSYASHAFSKVVSDAFLKIGKKIDINAIRHAYATHVLKDRISQTELQKVASAMGTSRSELYETYNKLDLE